MKKMLFIFAVLFFASAGCGDGAVQRITPVGNDKTDETQKENDSDQVPDDESGNEQVTGDSDSVTKDDSDPAGSQDTPVDNDPTDNPEPDNDNNPVNDTDPTDDPEPDDDNNPVNDTEPTDDPDQNPDNDNDPTEDSDTADDNDTEQNDDADISCCPAGTSLQNGVCEYDNCGQYAYYMNFQSKNGQLIFKEDPAASCYAEKNTAGEKVPCCCGKEIYKFKNGNVQDTYDTLIYATSFDNYGGVATSSEWTCSLPVQCE